MKVLVLNVVGLTPRLLAHMPRLAAVAERGFAVPLRPVLPAVTCSVQASMLTGLAPDGHGIVGNGWYFRELGEVLFWRQHNRLVGGEPVWAAARREHPGFTVANVCWWYAMGADTDWTVTPRPIYHADGRKTPDCYTQPAELHHELTSRLGPFPLFAYWGPGAGLASSAWIVGAARYLLAAHRPDLSLVYLPHLDYDLQRHGPLGSAAAAAAAELDRVLGPLVDDATRTGTTVVVVSEYGLSPVDRPVDINRLLRERGWLRVHTQAGMEYLDPWVSRAFAVADHQIAHVYLRDPADRPAVAELLAASPGVAEVFDPHAEPGRGLAHPRSGELVAVAEPGAWFTYYHWLDDARAPDFARTVDIHRKPGYDPAELLFDHTRPLVRARAAAALARRKLGFRATLDVVALDGSRVRGSHGRLPATAEEGPVLLCDDPGLAPDGESLPTTAVKGLLLAAARRERPR